MSFLWIGLGGALGSMARAWVALAVARITGPAFPWGTILINIVGSFVIGFFGTLTATDGRFSVPTDVRAFVMVGICGGFTTFSSFSLQTLDLARDGRMAQALGNVGLSVAMCLAAVAAGHYGAASLRHAPAAAAMQPAAPGRTVTVVLNRPEDTQPLLDTASALLAAGGGGLLRVLMIRMPPAAALLPSEEVLTAERSAAVRSEQARRAAALRTEFDRWSGRHGGPAADWIDVEDDAAAAVTTYGRRSDALVMTRPAAHQSEAARDCLHAALFETGCPLLLTPPAAHGPLGRTVAVAWKDDGRAGEAVRASLPFLRGAQAVHVFSAHRPATPPPALDGSGLAVMLHTLPDSDASVADQLLAAAHAVDADLLVMGAYAHGAWRERIFGGVTRAMLAHADIPVLMRH
jgi:protein CrcB